MSVCWEENRRPVPITQDRARMIASEVPLTWRQVVWVVNRASAETEDRGRAASLNDWVGTAPLEEVSFWVWEQWVSQTNDCNDCDCYYGV